MRPPTRAYQPPSETCGMISWHAYPSVSPRDWLPHRGFSSTTWLPAWDSWPAAATQGTAPSLLGTGCSWDLLHAACHHFGDLRRGLMAHCPLQPLGDSQHFTFTNTLIAPSNIRAANMINCQGTSSNQAETKCHHHHHHHHHHYYPVSVAGKWVWWHTPLLPAF